LGSELEVSWQPNVNSNLSGQVKGILDYAMSKVIEPYKEVTNKLITLINEDTYEKKEKLLDKLTSLL
ncbi:MAG: hypothetical protein QXF82_07915, partial [Nitrososphaeria archaeon]